MEAEGGYVSDALEEEVPIFEFVLTNDGAGHNLMIFEQDIRNVMMIKEHSQVHIIIQTHIFDMKNGVVKAVQKKCAFYVLYNQTESKSVVVKKQSVIFKFCIIIPNSKVLLSTKSVL